MEYLIIAGLGVAGYFAIRRWTDPLVRKWWYIGLGALVLLLILSAAGVFGTAAQQTINPFG